MKIIFGLYFWIKQKALFFQPGPDGWPVLQNGRSASGGQALQRPLEARKNNWDVDPFL